VTSRAFTPPPSEFGRGDVIISYHGRSFGFIAISGARLGVASERISHGWSMDRRARESEWDTNWASNLSFVNYSSSVNNQSGVRSSVFSIYPVSAKESRAFQFRHLRSSDFDDGKLVQSEYFGRSISSGVVIGMDPLNVIRASVRRPNDEMSEGMDLYIVDESN